MSNFQETANFIWQVADEILRDDFKRGKYSDVILPFTVLRRIDCVLGPTRERVFQEYQHLKEQGIESQESINRRLRLVTGVSFYNLSRFEFSQRDRAEGEKIGSLLDDPRNIGPNTIAYLNGFSPNIEDVISKFKLRATIEALNEKSLLFLMIRKFSQVDLHPDRVSNHEMGTIFEELLRKFNELANENPGEHFTPREVIRLMVRLLINGDRDKLKEKGTRRRIYDPACGTGGMLSVAKEYIREEINQDAIIHLFGQEVNDETYAVCKSDMLIKGDDAEADNIKPGSCFTTDGHRDSHFEYMLSNPPYGKDWKKEQDFIQAEAEDKGYQGRFGAGTPRVSDGQLLFLQHMIAKMNPVDQGGGRIAIVMNGSPLFTGDAGSGESEIRRWILENDWLEAIVALPGQLFYNTGINTYIWVLTNRKDQAHPERKGRVLLINGAATRQEGNKEQEVFARKMRRSLGDKRNELGDEDIDKLVQLALDYQEGPYCKVFNTTDFGYRKITVERPLRRNYQASPERIARLEEQSAFKNLALSRKKDPEVAAAEAAEGRETQDAIRAALAAMDAGTLYRDRREFEKALDAALNQARLKLSAPVKKAILTALAEPDPEAEICRDSKGNPEPDPELRDYENVPLGEDIYAYFEREVCPHVPDAWINQEVRDHKDGQVGKVGNEINFNRYFYQYCPPRPLEEIDADIKELEKEILRMLLEVTA